jgi:hypothetical protein
MPLPSGKAVPSSVPLFDGPREQVMRLSFYLSRLID